MTMLADIPASKLLTEYAGLTEARIIKEKLPNHGVTLPQWHPRMPLGIWNESAAIDVRNFTITPIP